MSEAAQARNRFPCPNPCISHWIAAPHRLASFRSADAVPSECDVAIIGAGMAGVSTAYHILSKAKPSQRPKVVLYEARQVCVGATGRNGGHTKLAPTLLMHAEKEFGAEMADQVAHLLLKNMRDLKSVVHRESLECDFLLRRSFDIFFDEQDASEMKDYVQKVSSRGQDWACELQWLQGANMDRITGVKGACGATTAPAASFWPYKFVTQLLERVMALGGELFAETPVLSVTEQPECSVVRTSRGDTKARKVIFATNAYTGALLHDYIAEITPYRGVNSHIVPASSDARQQPPFLSSTYNLRYGSGFYDYLVPQLDGGIVLGGGTQAWKQDPSHPASKTWLGSVDDSNKIEGVESYFESVMRERFNGWEDSGAKADLTWSGVMASTPDGFPRVGKVKGRSRQWLLAGFNGAGMTVIFPLAEAIADMVTQDLTWTSPALHWVPELYRSNTHITK